MNLAAIVTSKLKFLMLSEPHNSLFLKKQDGKVTLSCHTYDGSLIKSFEVTTPNFELKKDNNTTDDIDKLLGFTNHNDTIPLGVI